MTSYNSPFIASFLRRRAFLFQSKVNIWWTYHSKLEQPEDEPRQDTTTMSKAYGTIAVVDGEAMATPAFATVTGDVGPGFRRKQGHSCCGGCCDVRRAVIVVNCVMIGMLFLEIFSLSLVSHIYTDDDELEEEIERFPAGALMTIFWIEIAIYCIGIWGALEFSTLQLYVALALYTLIFVMNVWVFNLPAMLISGFFAYPHVFLIKEIKEGTMSESNYYNEEQSCCCVVP